MSNRITPILVTHYSPKSTYGKLAPPSAGLVNTAVRSMRTHLSGYSVEAQTPIIYYNRPFNQNEGSRKYGTNLQSLSDRLGFQLVIIPNYGLRNALMQALKNVSTPYTLFIEHDWKFVQNIDLTKILNMFDTDSDINYVRMNKRINKEAGYDTIVKEDTSRPVSLCQVSSYSNNPHIVRTSQYKKWVKRSNPSIKTFFNGIRRDKDIGGYGIQTALRIVKDKFLFSRHHVRHFDGVEFVLDTEFKKEISKYGFDTAHKEWGTYLYGPRGDGPYVTHLDGNQL